MPEPSTFDELLAIGEPLDRIRAIDEAIETIAGTTSRLRKLKAQAIRDLRENGEDRRRTWAEVGALLGVSEQRAEQLSRL